MWESAIAGVLLGLVSSFHCVGMCGPLALALPVHHLQRRHQAIAMLLYNAGRVVTYSLAGLVFGWAGRGVYMAGFQQWFSIGMGVVILALVILNHFLHSTLTPSWVRSFHGNLQQVMGRLLQSPKHHHYLFLGMANGLLPCGMVYLAIAGALSTVAVNQSVLFMASFGAGTMPAMLALSLFGMPVKLSLRRQLKKIMPFAIVCMAVLLILRGLNLGIPFVSPVLPEARQPAISCH
ncbi:MAG TPA: sulfite exporter TauE/SafE family protein [Niastella sp.]